LCTPLGDMRGIIWMHGKPGFDSGAAIRRQQAIHIGVKLVGRYWQIAIHHGVCRPALVVPVI
jgi:hypothetical protein